MRVVTLGETMALARATEIGSLAHAPTMKLGIGGAESNVAIALARLGVPTSWIGRLGTDSLGDLVVRELLAEGLDVHAIRDPEAPTGLMLKEHRTAASTKVWYYRAGSAGSRLTTDDLPAGLIASSSLLHVTGITAAISQTARDAMHAAIATARDAGVPVSFDLNYRSALWSRGEARVEFERLIRTADIVFGGDDELAIVTGDAAGPEELARRIADLGPGHVIVKLGAEGCAALVDGVLVQRAAVAVTPVDTVGAGDAFVAGYLAEYLAGASLEVRLETAVTAGAFACLVPGDWEGMPRRSELGMLAAVDPVHR